MLESEFEEVRSLLALHLLPGLGPRLTANLLQHFGTASAICHASAEQLQMVPHIGVKLAKQMSAKLQSMDVQHELELVRKHQTKIFTLGSPGYPAELAQIYDPPYVLYIRGELTPSDQQAVALVGSRSCTNYGKRITERLATDLARAGYTVISGLARGIDGFAHRAALQAGGRTLAVLANGLSKIYPPEHRELALEIASQGAVLSEAPMEQSPLPGMFPARNRLISGLSRAIVLVEAAERSGALITAEHAAEQGRIVFAVPGPVDHPSSAGTNDLLRKGAILCRHVDDIFEELQSTAPLREKKGKSEQLKREVEEREPSPKTEAKPSEPTKLEGMEKRIWSELEEPRNVDDLSERLGMSIVELSNLLFMLEIRKEIRRLPGNRFERNEKGK